MADDRCATREKRWRPSAARSLGPTPVIEGSILTAAAGRAYAAECAARQAFYDFETAAYQTTSG